VRKQANPDHARSELISLTPEGRALLSTLRADTDPHRVALLEAAELTREDLETARDVIRRLAAAFDDVDSSGSREMTSGPV
jgi:DNA-binding MarR family transcriptional regulator